MSQPTTETLPFLPSQSRLQAYQLIIDGCHHIWSKNKIQQEKALQALETIVPLAKDDPYFLAHLTSYIAKTSKSKDLQVFMTYVATLSSADGTPFSQGSEYKKPNLRYIGAAALHQLDPKLVLRIVKVANMKYGVDGHLNNASHFPTTLRTAIVKYLKYREAHLEMVTGIKKAGLGEVLKTLYVAMRMKPSEEVVKILRWKRKDIKVDFGERLYDFTDKTDLEIAELIRAEKIPYIGVIGELARVDKKVSPVIAVALLEQATGDQAVIMYGTFADAGILEDADVKKLYQEKIATAKTTLDRVDRIKKIAEDEEGKLMLSEARAENRQAQTAGIGKIYIHIDDSSSMTQARQFAMEKATILAECVNDPANNFRWGVFGSRGQEVALPEKFVKDAFAEKLFQVRDGGSTNCFALYDNARKFGADVDLFITDQGHTDGDLSEKIRSYHIQHPDVAKPRACVIVFFTGTWAIESAVKDAYEANGIPVTIIQPDKLSESALVVDSVKTAVLGPVALVDEIMETPLLELPQYYYSI